MKLRFGLLSTSLLLIVAVLMVTFSNQRQPIPILNTSDVSWPNCQATPPHSLDGIVGVTGGLDFTYNKCVRSETLWFGANDTALYMNTGWPGISFHLQFPSSPLSCSDGDSDCFAYNYGFHAAQYAISYANSQLLHSSMWWLDVETENSWTTNMLQNQMALKGMIAAIKQYGFGSRVGFYSSPDQWSQIVGSWQPNFPSWIATGSTLLLTAQQSCKLTSFTAQPIVLAQYTPSLDQDYSCPRSAAIGKLENLQMTIEYTSFSS